jgi:superfamily I DNA/RNA helicase
LAWTVAAFQDFNCVAVDEIQDLTPLEFFVVLKLARRLNEAGRLTPLLLAGDEAQTIRATDFEWAWLNDMVHTTLSQPQEFKMSVNLRSPRRIADLVNRACVKGGVKVTHPGGAKGDHFFLT